VKPALAVLVTYHNEGALLTECLSSLAAQSGVAEVIVFDDASKVRPEAYLPANVPVQVLRSEQNVGPSVGRNQLLAASRADYIHFHDADDLFLPGWLSQVCSGIADGVDCVFTEVETIHENGAKHSGVIGLERLERNRDLLAFALQHSILTVAGTYRRELAERIGGYNERLWQSEDYDFHARVALAQPSWRLHTQSLVRARVRNLSRSRREEEVWLSAWQALRELQPEVPASHLPDLAAFSEKVGRHLLRLGRRDEGLAAIQFAEDHGVRSSELQPAYRWLARRVGLVRAHRFASIYRALLPAGVRQLLAAFRNS
jgi:glycosyltransferase involved in cell wall biosynthesis